MLITARRPQHNAGSAKESETVASDLPARAQKKGRHGELDLAARRSRRIFTAPHGRDASYRFVRRSEDTAGRTTRADRGRRRPQCEGNWSPGRSARVAGRGRCAVRTPEPVEISGTQPIEQLSSLPASGFDILHVQANRRARTTASASGARDKPGD